MRVRQLINHLLECNLQADVVVINKNDPGDEFTIPSGPSVIDAMDLDSDRVVLYYAGPAPELDDAE